MELDNPSEQELEERNKIRSAVYASEETVQQLMHYTMENKKHVQHYLGTIDPDTNERIITLQHSVNRGHAVAKENDTSVKSSFNAALKQAKRAHEDAVAEANAKWRDAVAKRNTVVNDWALRYSEFQTQRKTNIAEWDAYVEQLRNQYKKLKDSN